MLGAIIERLLETGYEAATQERVLAPLGPDRSCFFAHEAITYSAAVGHNKFPGKELAVARPYPLPRCMNAAGAIIAPAGDLLRFAAFHLGDGTVAGKRILSAATLQAMQTVAVGDHTFLVVDGESEGSTLDFILDESAAERPRFIRLHGRLADRKDRA